MSTGPLTITYRCNIVEGLAGSISYHILTTLTLGNILAPITIISGTTLDRLSLAANIILVNTYSTVWPSVNPIPLTVMPATIPEVELTAS